jgi:hypothetical protein
MSNTSTVKLEIFVPGKVILPSEYKNIAVRYNNANIALNPNFSDYIEDNEIYTDTTNLDSIASEIYFQNFVSNLKNQQFFDSVIVLEPMDYSDIELNDSLVYAQFKSDVSEDTGRQVHINKQVFNYAQVLRSLSYPDSVKSKTKYIDPDFCLYSVEEIQQILDSLGADLLLSFDYFGTTHGIFSPKYVRNASDTAFTVSPYFYDYNEATEVVLVLTAWNFYDLQKQELIYSHIKSDTIKWDEPAYNMQKAKRVLPPRKDAVLNAADIAGSRFAEYLTPHWIEVERMYYKSGHIELKKNNDLIKQNRWLEAAEIWKKNTTNKNKKIAAKSMFNMALACEMNGDMDAAIDWAVKSFYARKNDTLHTENCQSYIFILGRRKLDIKRIEGE